MRTHSRTDHRPEEPDEVLERTMEQAERRLEAQIDSIGAGGLTESREAADAECTAARASAHRASADAGVKSSNTPPPSSKNDEIGNWIGAEDWLQYCLYVEWDKNWPDLNNRLKRAKEDAAVEGAPPGFCDIYFMGGSATVSPSGVPEGGVYFAYKLTYEEVSVLIAERESPHKTFPSVRIVISGTGCLYPGVTECYEKANRMIEALGGKIVRNKLSRVDICLDMPEVEIDPLDRAFLEKRYICRAVATARHSGTGVTIAFGKSPLMCRIYDKKAEVALKANPHKNLCMRVYRWKCNEMPSAATRVEFELRREALKERGIDTVEDYYAKRADLVHYLTNWLRFTANKVDRENKNQSKARTLPLWNKVRKAFKRWAGEPPGRSLEPLPKEKANVRNLMKQALGVVKAAAGFQGKEITDREGLIAYMNEAVVKYGIRPKQKTKKGDSHVISAGDNGNKSSVV